MIVPVLRLTRWEWFKLRKRWMPWILLGIVVIVTQISVWGSSRPTRVPERPSLRSSVLALNPA